MNRNETLIERLGGSRYLAKELGENLSTVSNWRRQGIPWRVRPKLADMAKERDVELPNNFLGI